MKTLQKKGKTVTLNVTNDLPTNDSEAVVRPLQIDNATGANDLPTVEPNEPTKAKQAPKAKGVQYVLQDIAKTLDCDFGVRIFASLTMSEPRNKKATRLFDATRKTSEVFYETSKHNAPMVYDYREGNTYFAVNAYAKRCNLQWKDAVIALGKEYALIPHNYEPTIKYATPPAPKKIITEKEQTKGVWQITNPQFLALEGVYLEFWAKWGVSLDYLQKSKIQGLKSFDLVNVETGEAITKTPEKLAFAYEVSKDIFKIYQPFEIKYKWSWCFSGEAQKPKDVIYYLECLPKDCPTLLIVEGLKDCLAVNANFNAFGVYAVGLDSATTELTKEAIEGLKMHSNNVILCLDNDKTGKEQNEAKSQTTGLSYLPYLPTFEGCKDFADLCEKQDKETILQWVQSEPQTSQNKAPHNTTGTKKGKDSDHKESANSKAKNNLTTKDIIEFASEGQQGVANMIAYLFENEFLCNANSQSLQWFYYDSGVWQNDSLCNFENLVFPTIKSILEGVKNDLTKQTKALATKINSFGESQETEKATTIKEMQTIEVQKTLLQKQIAQINTAKGQKDIAYLVSKKMRIKRDMLDTNPYLLCLENGVFNFESMQLEAHSPTKYLTIKTPIAYNEGAKCELWHTFIGETFGGDFEIMEFMQKLFGLCLVGEQIDKVFFFWGEGANGKSVLVETLRLILGAYYKKSDNKTFVENKNVETKRKFCGLEGKRAIVSGEFGENVLLDEKAVKDFTGGEIVECEYKFENAFEYVPQGKLILYGNHKPIIKGTDNGFWRRFLCVPFENIVPENKQNKNLKNDLQTEKEGVLLWAIQGYQLYKKEGLQVPTTIMDFTNEYQKEQDIIGNFVSECLEARQGAKVLLSKVFDALQVWCNKNKTLCPHVSVRTLRKDFEKRGFLCKEGAGRGLYLFGFDVLEFEKTTYKTYQN